MTRTLPRQTFQRPRELGISRRDYAEASRLGDAEAE